MYTKTFGKKFPVILNEVPVALDEVVYLTNQHVITNIQIFGITFPRQELEPFKVTWKWKIY